MDDQDGYHGHMTMVDGSHVPLSASDAKALMEAFKAADEKAASDMPDTKAALIAMGRAQSRLAKLGWRHGMYCPKDGSEFAIIMFGSTGIFPGWFHGKWPYDFIDYGDGGWHPHGCLWKPLADLTDGERTTMQEGIESHRQWLDHQAAMFDAMQDDER